MLFKLSDVMRAIVDKGKTHKARFTVIVSGIPFDIQPVGPRSWVVLGPTGIAAIRVELP